MADESTAQQESQTRWASLLGNVGSAITQFAILETHLLLLFAKALDLPPATAAQLIQPVRNFSTTLDIIDVAVRHKLRGTQALSYWTSLLDYVRELSGDRNYLAHSPLIVDRSGEKAKADHKIGPSIASVLSGEAARVAPMSLEEVTQIIADFDQATQFVMDLQFALGEPLPDRFSQPIARRRPSRGIRLAASRPAPPPRPPSSRPLRDKKKERGEK